MADQPAGTSNGVVSHASKSSSLGGFFKRMSPKFHRSRSKSPMTNGSGRSKNKSWVTVEIKNGDDEQGGGDNADRKFSPTSSPPNVVRSGTDGQLSSTTSCSTSSVPGSPMSSSSLHNGFSSPSSPSRVRSSFGNLFNRGSFKKQHQQKSATLQMTTTNKHDNINLSSSVDYETRTRTRSEHEVNNDTDDIERRRIQKSSTTVAASAKSKFDAFIAQLSHKTHSDGGGSGRDSSKNSSTQQPEVGINAVGRAALSEENLVSKSFVCENTSICLSPDPIASSTTTTANGVGAAKFLPPSCCLSASTGYHSQDSVFDSPPNAAARVPSYVRLSCTLSGYKNYRNVDIRTPSPVRSPQMPRIVENFSTTIGGESSATVVDRQQNQQHHNINAVVHQLPAGKSLVERRLEKFQAIKIDEKKSSSSSTNETPIHTNGTDLINGATPTPIRDIISSFNKLNLNDSSLKSATAMTTTSTPLAAPRPRQKPPPVPPRFDSLVDEQQVNGNPNNNFIISHKSNGFKEPFLSPTTTTTTNGSLLNDVLSAADAIEEGANVSNDTFVSANETFVSSNVDFYATIESNATTTSMNNSSEAAICAVVVEPVKSYVDKSIVVGEQKSFNGRTIKVDDDADADHHASVATSANGGERRTACSTAASNVKNESLMNGHDYRVIAIQQRQRLEKLLNDAENDLKDETIPENASEKLRMAVGKLRLLLRKKFATFEDLIEKNLNPIPDDPRPTLDLDLAGYYQLVEIELVHIDNYFGVVERLRANGWRQCESEDEVDSKPPTKPIGNRMIPVASKSTTNVSSEAASKAKDAARQRLKDARNAAMERKKANDANGDDVQFFGQ